MPKINIHPLQSNSRHSGNRLVRYDSHPARYDNRPVLPDNRPPPGHSFLITVLLCLAALFLITVLRLITYGISVFSFDFKAGVNVCRRAFS